MHLLLLTASPFHCIAVSLPELAQLDARALALLLPRRQILSISGLPLLSQLLLLCVIPLLLRSREFGTLDLSLLRLLLRVACASTGSAQGSVRGSAQGSVRGSRRV